MPGNNPKPAKGPPRPNVGNEPIDLPAMLRPKKRKRKTGPRPGVRKARGTPDERAGSLEKAPGE